MVILRQTVLEIFEGLISCRTNEHIEGYHIRRKRLIGVSPKTHNTKMLTGEFLVVCCYMQQLASYSYDFVGGRENNKSPNDSNAEKCHQTTRVSLSKREGPPIGGGSAKRDVTHPTATVAYDACYHLFRKRT